MHGTGTNNVDVKIRQEEEGASISNIIKPGKLKINHEVTMAIINYSLEQET